MTIHVPRRGTKRSWIAIWALVGLTIAVVATGYFGLQSTP
jgi:hypothetical protein